MLKLCRFAVAAAAVAMLSVLFAAGAEAKVVARAASGTPFRLGYEGSFTGPSAAALGDEPAIATAWAKWWNAHGGINGHPIKLFVLDDGGGASTALQNAQTLVQQDHVQALVDLSSQDSAFQAYITKTGVPVTGGNTTEHPFTSSPDWFPSGTDESPPVFYDPGAIAKKKGFTKWGDLACAEFPICAGFFTPFGNAVKIFGEAQVYTGTVAADAPNYTAQCLAAKQAGVQAMMIADTINVDQRVIDNCAQQGIKFDYFVPTGLTPAVIKDPAANGLNSMYFTASILSTKLPGVALFHKIVNKYAPQIRGNSAWGDEVLEGFNGLELFRLDATMNKLRPSSTPAKVKAGLYKLPSTTLGGLAPPLKFTKGKVTLVNGGFWDQIVNGKEVPHGLITIPSSKLATFYTAIGG